MKAWLKGAWRSVTIHFNLWFGLLLASLPTMQDQFPALQPYLPTDFFKWGTAALVVGNVILRIKTSASLAQKGQ